MWKVVILREADKQLRKLPKLIQALAFESLEELAAEGPKPSHWDVRKLSDNEYRLRINYRYRICYRVIPMKFTIEVFYIGHRKDAYR